MGADYYRGAVMFCEALRPRALVPMHFGSHFDPPKEFFDEASQFTCVARVGSRNTLVGL
jgi:L-ascorbate metabolism protein UlaG (beta-lactamase superfamily)